MVVTSSHHWSPLTKSQCCHLSRGCTFCPEDSAAVFSETGGYQEPGRGDFFLLMMWSGASHCATLTPDACCFQHPVEKCQGNTTHHSDNWHNKMAKGRDLPRMWNTGVSCLSTANKPGLQGFLHPSTTSTAQSGDASPTAITRHTTGIYIDTTPCRLR